jgi:cephalosporin-C deacetylase
VVNCPGGWGCSRGAVVGHGYGGRDTPDTEPPFSQRVVIYPCAPGFNLSTRADIPDNGQEHVLHGKSSRETYILRHSTTALWSAASVLLALFPQVVGNIVCAGVSFGGGLGALALPWRVHLSVPTFGHHPIRLHCSCQGSGEAVRSYYRMHPEAVNVLAYYDAAVAVARISIPVLVSPALFDPAVPSPGQFAVANAISQHELFILSEGHFTHAGEEQENQALRNALERWFALT